MLTESIQFSIQFSKNRASTSRLCENRPRSSRPGVAESSREEARLLVRPCVERRSSRPGVAESPRGEARLLVRPCAERRSSRPGVAESSREGARLLLRPCVERRSSRPGVAESPREGARLLVRPCVERRSSRPGVAESPRGEDRLLVRPSEEGRSSRPGVGESPLRRGAQTEGQLQNQQQTGTPEKPRGIWRNGPLLEELSARAECGRAKKAPSSGRRRLEDGLRKRKGATRRSNSS
jgi:hypothetical protein